MLDALMLMPLPMRGVRPGRRVDMLRTMVETDVATWPTWLLCERCIICSILIYKVSPKRSINQAQTILLLLAPGTAGKASIQRASSVTDESLTTACYLARVSQATCNAQTRCDLPR